jgi:pyruvate,water dikinase
MSTSASPYVLAFDAATEQQAAQLGGKCASLARMIRSGAPVPPGFAVTTAAYGAMLAPAAGESSGAIGLAAEITAALRNVARGDVVAQDQAARHIAHSFASRPLPADVAIAVTNAYLALCAAEGADDDLPVAVRSSATAEDLPDASFAGQQDTYLWVVGTAAVLQRVRDCWASLYTARAIGYRDDRGIAHHEVLMAVGVQKMVDAQVAGVAMTLDPCNGDRTRIVIDASWGLGEGVVSGEVTPDHFVVDKVLRAVVGRTISTKALEVVPDPANRRTLHRAVPTERQTVACLNDRQVLAVAMLSRQLEKQYGAPQDVEWAIEHDPRHPDGRLLALQCRPETVWSQRKAAASTTATTPGPSSPMSGLVSSLLTPVRIQL